MKLALYGGEPFESEFHPHDIRFMISFNNNLTRVHRFSNWLSSFRAFSRELRNFCILKLHLLTTTSTTVTSIWGTFTLIDVQWMPKYAIELKTIKVRRFQDVDFMCGILECFQCG
jgi:hypothetical protein